MTKKSTKRLEKELGTPTITPKTTRTLTQIQTEYDGLTAALGDLTYRYKIQSEQVMTQMFTLNREAHAIKEAEAKTEPTPITTKKKTTETQTQVSA